MRRAIACAGLLALVGCAPEIPDATYVCTTTSECPPSMSCFRGLCVREPGDAGTSSCRPLTCEDRNARCGSIDDGCGGARDCGTCTAPETCGGFPDAPNVCGCLPWTQCMAEDCGEVSNGCGGTLTCGGCMIGECVDGRCGCTPPACGPDDCGELPNKCGGDPVDCGGCDAPDTCGGGGLNRCGRVACVPTTCEAVGATCGQVSDGCSAVLECGECADNERCTSTNVCECLPKTCASPGVGCGRQDDGCGGALSCACTAPQECDGSGTCACPPAECMPGSCAVVGTGACTTTCMCRADQVCDGTSCVCPADGYEPNETADTAASGTALGPGIGVRVEAIVSTATDRDWLQHEILFVAPTGPYVFEVRVEDVPPGASFALGVYPICRVSNDLGPTCMRSAEHVEGSLRGCRAEGSPPSLQIEVAECAPSAVLVVVSAVTWTDACTPYAVTTEFQGSPL